MFPTMYAPPWAREGARDAPGDAAMAAVDQALNASEEFRRTLPAATPLAVSGGKRRWRDKPFDGDIAARHLRERSLDPVAMPAPPRREPASAVGVFARVSGAIGLAALAAFFMAGTAPLSLAVKAEGEGAPASFLSRFVVPTSNREQAPQDLAFILASADNTPVALAERFAAVSPAPDVAPGDAAVPAQPVKTLALSPAVLEAAPPPQPSLRALDRQEIAMLVKRSEDLVAQGDIAAARLLLRRAAEAGDAGAALALGSTYDAGVLRELGVLGVAADARQAREWYAKAAEFGSSEAKRRLEQFAQSVR